MVKRITKFHPLRGFNQEEGVDVLLPLLAATALTVYFPILSNLWVLAFWGVVLVSSYDSNSSADGGGATGSGTGADGSNSGSGKKKKKKTKQATGATATKGGDTARRRSGGRGVCFWFLAVLGVALAGAAWFVRERRPDLWTADKKIPVVVDFVVGLVGGVVAKLKSAAGFA